MWTSKFWKAAGERAVKTFAQALVAAIGAGAAGVADVDWLQAVSVAGLAAVISVLTSIGSTQVTGGHVSLGGEKLQDQGPVGHPDFERGPLD